MEHRQFVAKGLLDNLDSPALNHEITRKHYFDGHAVDFVKDCTKRAPDVLHLLFGSGAEGFYTPKAA